MGRLMKRIWPRLVCCVLLLACLPQLQCESMFKSTSDCFDTHIRSNKANIEKNAAMFCKGKGFKRSAGYSWSDGYIVEVCCDD